MKLQAANWQKKNNISEVNYYYYCTNVYEKIKDFGNSFGQAHRSIRTVKQILILIGTSEAAPQKCTENMQQI